MTVIKFDPNRRQKKPEEPQEPEKPNLDFLSSPLFPWIAIISIALIWFGVTKFAQANNSQKEAKTIEKVQEACDAGNGAQCAELALHYMSSRQIDEAKTALQKSCNFGHQEACDAIQTFAPE